jgi:hypothetical protein
LNDLLIQPGAIIQCFDFSVASHDDPSPASSPSWAAPPTTTAKMTSNDEDVDTAQSCRPASSSAEILENWKPRVLPLPDWMDEDIERDESHRGAP